MSHSNSPRSQRTFGFGFTAASLRPELLLIIAECFVRTGSWEKTRSEILSSNALQCRSRTSSERLERELRPRLQTLTERQIELLVDSSSDTRKCLAWLAAVKHSAFLYEFAAEVLRGKLLQCDPVLRESDYNHFVEEKGLSHPELSALSGITIAKVRRVLLAMLREVGILSKGEGIGVIHRPVLAPQLESAVRDEDAAWLAAFLVPDSEHIK